MSDNPFSSLLKRADGLLSRATEKTEGWTVSQALLALFILNLLTVTPLIIGHHVLAHPDRGTYSDLYLFRDRAQTIVDGDLLYRDTDNATMTPPGINYLLVPPLLLGDHMVVWELWFSLFNFLTAAVLYYILREFKPELAFVGAGLYVTSPFAFFTAISMIQDDTIIPLFVALATLYLVRNRHVISATWVGLGLVVKMFPVVTAPLLLISARDKQTRLKVACAGIGVTLLICSPFLLLAPNEFMAFVEFYLLGKDPTGKEVLGMSMWRFLSLAGIHIPNAVNLVALLFALCGIWVLVGRKRLPVHNGFALSFLMLFILYAKLHFGYYLLMLLVLIPWALSDWRRMVGLVMAGWVARRAHLGWRGRFDMFGDELGLAFLASLLLLFCIWWAHQLMKGESPSDSFAGKDIARLRTAAAWVCLLGICYAWRAGIDRIILAA